MHELRYNRKDVAQCYYPNLFPAAAWCQFFNTACKDIELQARLFGTVKLFKRTYFTKAQLELIKDRMGKPKLNIFGTYDEQE